MKEVILPSGAKLEITPSPFGTAKALFQAVLEEMKELKLDKNLDDVSVVKDLFCAGFSSKRIESALNECMKRVLYDGLKISDDTFEPVKARQDYLMACIEVAKENIHPFTKSLSAAYSAILGLAGTSPA